MYDFEKTEEEVLKFWKQKKIYEKLRKKNSKGKKYFLLDGPPYANFIPHVGHIKNTVFKDLFIRLAFLKGFNVLFQPGFDTHGLPIENMVEKKLGLRNKKDIKKFGISRFMKECKKNAALNKDLWMKVYKKLGSMYYLKDPYITYENYYIESAWWAFKKMYEKGMVYQGKRSVMWCSHCETSLAGYEVTDSYKDLKDTGIYVLFKLKDSDEYLLIYTTTPWTLPSNVAIAALPSGNYVKIKLEDGRKIILGEKRLEKLSEIGISYKIIEKIKGEKLIGNKYEPILDIPLQKDLKKDKNAHKVIASISLLKERVASKVRAKKKVDEKSKDIFEEFVTMDEGSGFVHTAPGHGKTDFMIGQHYNLPQPSPVDEQGHLIPELTKFKGYVKDADKDILETLRNQGSLLHEESIIHSYPLCWRCKNPLIFRLSKQLFFKVNKVKTIMEKENEKVSWFPDFSKDRFDRWISNAEDWNISRQRYWGIPIPIWKCECGEEKIIENKKELEKLSRKKIQDLHSVENLRIKCEKCGGDMEKIKGILDVWFDSGVAPWASLGYPVKNKELFEAHFPVNRINEAEDQIRGWFYSLMFCSAAVFGKAPYKEVSMVAWVLDKKGHKMSKSVGNVTTAEEAIADLGADVLRYYFCWDVAPFESQKFNSDIAKKEIFKVINVLWNLQNLVENKNPSNKKSSLEDAWILSKMNSLTEFFKKNIDNFEIHTATRELSNFILNDLSRDYIQMTRAKLNSDVLIYCYERILKLLAPITPLITEKIWQGLRKKKIVKEESVHLCSWPKTDKKKINKKLELKFSWAFKAIEAGLAERDKVGIGLRWPLAKIIINAKEHQSLKVLNNIIKSQLNVKKIELKSGHKIRQDQVTVKLDTTMTPELEAEGYAREMSRQVQAFRKKLGLEKKNKVDLFIITDSKFKKVLEKQKEFIIGRTNSKKLEIVITEKERFKNKTYFSIKDKRGQIAIIVTDK